jgi:hypothetical protein
MDNLSLPPQTPSPAIEQPFKNWTDCMKALKKLPHPPAESDRQSIVTRLQSSPLRLFIAFEYLWWRQKAGAASKFSWLETEAIQILGNGDPAPKLASLTAPAEAGQWVFHELGDINTPSDWEKYIASGRHLWLLHAILQCAANKPALIEAMLALVECVEHVQNCPINGKPKKTPVNAADPQWIARTIKSRIAAKLSLSKAFIETIFSLNATATISETLRTDSNSLRSQLQKVTATLQSETEAKTNAENREQQLKIELAKTKQELAKTAKELEDEKKHTIRTGGFSGVAKQETVNQVMAIVRQGVTHRLESIRQFADREKPNREEILELVSEVEKQLAGVEERLKQ